MTLWVWKWEKGGGVIVSITYYNTTVACSFTLGLSLSSQWPLVPWGLPLHRWALRWRQGARGWEDGRAWSQGLPINSRQLLHAELLPVTCRQKIWSRSDPRLWKGEKRLISAPFKEKKVSFHLEQGQQSQDEKFAQAVGACGNLEVVVYRKENIRL